MNTVQIVVLIFAAMEILFGAYWLFIMVPRTPARQDSQAEHARLRDQGGFIQRRSLRDKLMINDPRVPEGSPPRQMLNPQAVVGLTMIFGGLIIAAVAMLFLGDAG